MHAEKITIADHPWPTQDHASFQGLPWADEIAPPLRPGFWPARWIAHADGHGYPTLAAYRLQLDIGESDSAITIHIAADQGYDFYLDGQLVGSGSEIPCASHWSYDSYRIQADPGSHVLVARVWTLGPYAPSQYLSQRHGLIVAATDLAINERLATGIAPWQTKLLSGYRIDPDLKNMGTGSRSYWQTHAEDSGWEQGEGEGWIPAHDGPLGRGGDQAVINMTHHALQPARLPDLDHGRWQGARVLFIDDASDDTSESVPCDPTVNRHDECTTWQDLLDGSTSVHVPPNSQRRILIDLTDYCCARPQLSLGPADGCTITIGWSESLYDEAPSRKHRKGHRDTWQGKLFLSRPYFSPDHYRGASTATAYHELHMRAGRWVQVCVSTGDAGAEIVSLAFHERRYPLSRDHGLASDDDRLLQCDALCRRTLECCSHDIFMDCPYYEQSQWVGDAWLESLLLYTIDADDRLPRQSLIHTASTQAIDGQISAISPCPADNRTILPTFTLYWIRQITDFARWRGDMPFIRSQMVQARFALDRLVALRHADTGVCYFPEWNFLDWVKGWPCGDPQKAVKGPHASMSFLLSWTLSDMADVEDWLGETHMAARWRSIQREITESCRRHFWHNERACFADTLEKDGFSEHSLSLALLAGGLSDSERAGIHAALQQSDAITTADLFGSHLLFEALAHEGLAADILPRLSPWYDMLGIGLKTCLEANEPSRSDCHAFSAHPLFHFRASLLGVRPAAMGFSQVSVRPSLGDLKHLKGSVAHPLGPIRAKLARIGDEVDVDITLPAGLTGTLRWQGSAYPLRDTVSIRLPS